MPDHAQLQHAAMLQMRGAQLYLFDLWMHANWGLCCAVL